MKVSLGCRLQSGPWGGGNQFAHSLADYLMERGVDVIFDLSEADIDLILLLEPRPRLRFSAYTDFEIMRYLRSVNANAIVVHRVNECDERKDTRDVNRILRRANLCADATIFVSEWLRDLHLGQGMKAQNSIVIRNGADSKIFNSEGYQRWDGISPLRLVTHHWGANQRKGFDIYALVDEMISARVQDHAILFTYIGNLPAGFRFKNADYITPLSGADLAQAIRYNHIYLTASQFEPGSNHQNEGACCGLPLLFRDSGSLPEYCSGFGLMFNLDNFEEKLVEMICTYPSWADKMEHYPHTSDRTNKSYYQYFQELLDRRQELIRKRQRRRAFEWLMSSQPIDLVRAWRGRP